MNAKAIWITVILVVTFAILGWLRSDGVYDFDVRTVLPFLSGREPGIYDWGGLVLLGLGLWGIGRVRRQGAGADALARPTPTPDDFELDDDIDSDASVV